MGNNFAFAENLAFHETGRAAGATNTMCAGQAMVAGVTDAPASHVPYGRELDGSQRGKQTAARLARIKSRQ
jgi:hypothetical protein